MKESPREVIRPMELSYRQARRGRRYPLPRTETVDDLEPRCAFCKTPMNRTDLQVVVTGFSDKTSREKTLFCSSECLFRYLLDSEREDPLISAGELARQLKEAESADSYESKTPSQSQPELREVPEFP